jgi:hypothetical protein
MGDVDGGFALGHLLDGEMQRRGRCAAARAGAFELSPHPRRVAADLRRLQRRRWKRSGPGEIVSANGAPLERTRRAWPWIVATVAIAIALRLPTIGRESLWLDEAISYVTATLPVARIVDNTVQSSHPPLYYLLLHAWLKVVPRTDGAARLLSAGWNVLLVPAIYWLSTELGSSCRRGLYAALLVAVSPFQILYSQELRMYTQLMLLVTVGTAAYLRARQSGGTAWWLAFGGAYLAAVYTHLFAFLALGALGLHALLRHRNRVALINTAVVAAAVTVLFSPWVGVLWRETQRGTGSMLPLNDAPTARLTKPLTATAFLVFGVSTTLPYTGFALFAVLSTAIVLPLAARKRRQRGEPTELALPGLMVGCVLGIPVAAYWIRPFLLTDRVMAAASPFLLLLVAWGLDERESPLPYIAYAVAAALVGGCVLYMAGDRIKPAYREAVGLVAQQRVEAEAVVYTSEGSYIPGLRYADGPGHVLLEGDPDPRKPRGMYEQVGGEVWSLRQVEEARGRLWLVVALDHAVDRQMAQVERIASRRRLLRSYSVEGIQVMLYGPVTETE